GGERRGCLARPEAFKVGHKEEAVSSVVEFRNLNWATQGETVLVLTIGLAYRRWIRRASRARVKVVGPGVQPVVAKEFEDRSVVFVRARLRGDVHLSGFAAELRGINAGLNLEFLESLHRRQKDVGIEVDVGVGDAIQRV